jgi:hypothetical protein
MLPSAQSSNAFAQDQPLSRLLLARSGGYPASNAGGIPVERGILTAISSWISIGATIMIRPQSQGML